MDYIHNNLTDDAISLVMSDAFSKAKKKPLLSPNVVVSFVGKLTIPKTTMKFSLPHRSTGISVCVFVKDMRKTDFEASNIAWQSRWKRDLAASSVNNNLPPVTFIPISELKLAYQSFDAKRKLAATFDVFLADKRIVHHLPSNLGKAFYGSTTSKLPIPISVDGKNLVLSITSALKSSLALFRGNGTTETIVVGDVDMPTLEVKENIISVVSSVLEKWPGGLSTLRSIYIRGVGPSVPIYFDQSEVVSESLPKKLKRTSSKEPDTEDLDSDVKCRLLAKKLKISEAKLPIDDILEVAKSLPLDEVDITQIFLQKRKREKKNQINKPNKTNKVGGSQRRLKHKRSNRK